MARKMFFGASGDAMANALQALVDDRRDQRVAFGWRQADPRCIDQVALQVFDEVVHGPRLCRWSPGR